jgi:DNA-3-methyladenine glycosylase I
MQKLPKGLTRATDGTVRCWWPGDDPLYQRYHDEEWGVPVVDDRRLFEKICLEGFQSGLSWLTILRKRDNFRAAFAGFDVDRVARFTARDVNRLLNDAGIIRHRGKIESAINNAKRAGELRQECGSLATYFWRWQPEAGARPKRVTWPALMKMSTTPASIALSKDLKKRGWTFVGPTTVYAFMQAMGMVNDHLDGCFRRGAIERLRDAGGSTRGAGRSSGQGAHFTPVGRAPTPQA